MTLPTDAKDRKGVPIATGVLDYFPDALAEIAKVSLAGQKQHGTTGWDRSKSTDEADALIRHFLARGTRDIDGIPHSAKMAWRALALLQKEVEGCGTGLKALTKRTLLYVTLWKEVRLTVTAYFTPLRWLGELWLFFRKK